MLFRLLAPLPVCVGYCLISLPFGLPCLLLFIMAFVVLAQWHQLLADMCVCVCMWVCSPQCRVWCVTMFTAPRCYAVSNNDDRPILIKSKNRYVCVFHFHRFTGLLVVLCGLSQYDTEPQKLNDKSCFFRDNIVVKFWVTAFEDTAVTLMAWEFAVSESTTPLPTPSGSDIQRAWEVVRNRIIPRKMAELSELLHPDMPPGFGQLRFLRSQRTRSPSSATMVDINEVWVLHTDGTNHNTPHHPPTFSQPHFFFQLNQTQRDNESVTDPEKVCRGYQRVLNSFNW